MRCFLKYHFGIFLVIIGFTASGMSADWPNYLGPNKNQTSPETNINKDWKSKPPKTLWTVKLKDKGFSGPAVADNKVFIIDRKNDKIEKVRALEIETGDDIWNYTYPDIGKETWGYGRTTPAYLNEKLFTVGRNGMVHCFEANTGKKIWGVNVNEKYNGRPRAWRMSISPVIDSNILLTIPGGHSNVVALNKNTGEMAWKGGLDEQAGYSTPAVAKINGKKQYIVFTAKHLMGLNPKNGSVIWSLPWQTGEIGWDVNAITPMVIDDSHIFISTDYQTGCALLKITGNKVDIIYKNKNLLTHFNTPVLYKGLVYSTSHPNSLKCLDLKTGKIHWEKEGFEKGGCILVDGVIIVLAGKTGEVIMLEPGPEYKELGRIKPLGGKSWAPPIFAHNKLFIRNMEKLACIDLSK